MIRYFLSLYGVLVASAALLVANAAFAVDMPPATDSAVSMVTGSATGTYFRFGNDIKNTLDTIDISVESSKGSLDNVEKISTDNAIGLGIVQADVLGFLKRSKNPQFQEIYDNVRLIMPLYPEEIHVIATKKIRRFSDLNGKRIIVGAKGSGSWLTSMNMFRLTGVTPKELLRETPEKGMVAVLKGEADAMVFVAGKPVTLFKNLEDLAISPAYQAMLDEVHFIAIEDDALLTEYQPATLHNADYNYISKDIPTIAVASALVARHYDAEAEAEQCTRINSISQAIISQLDALKKTGHPKWQQVDPQTDIAIWQRSDCVEALNPLDSLESGLLELLSKE